jgi:hypothetical protein
MEDTKSEDAPAASRSEANKLVLIQAFECASRALEFVYVTAQSEIAEVTGPRLANRSSTLLIMGLRHPREIADHALASMPPMTPSW